MSVRIDGGSTAPVNSNYDDMRDLVQMKLANQRARLADQRAKDASGSTNSNKPTFDDLHDPVSNKLKGLLTKVRNDTTTDPAKQRANQVAEAALEALLWAQEAENRKKQVEDKQAETDKTGRQYGTNSLQYQKALADQRAAEASWAEAVARSNEASAQLDVYATDPAYKSAMKGAGQQINGALAPLGKGFNMPKPIGTHAQALDALAKAQKATQDAVQANEKYQKAAADLAQLPDSYVPGQQYTPPSAIITNPGGDSYDVIVARETALYATWNRTFADAQLNLAQGDKLLTDFQVDTLQSNIALTKPGSPENKQIQSQLDALTGPNGLQAQAASNVTTAQALFDAADAKATDTGLLLQKQLISDRALGVLHQTNGYLFDPNGYTDGNDHYSGKLKSVTVVVKNGQLYAEFTYEHKTLEMQLTFAPGKRWHGNANSNQVDQDWHDLMTDPKTCTTNRIDAAAHRAVDTQKKADDLQLKQLDLQIGQLRQAYQQALADHPVPYGPYLPGHGPKVDPAVTTAKNNLDTAIQLRTQFFGTIQFLDFLGTQDLSNFETSDDQKRLQNLFFVSNGDERQRRFNSLQADWGKPVSLQDLQTSGPAAGKIRDIGGKDAKVQVLPAFFAPDAGGLQDMALFEVTDSNGDMHIVDENGRDYDSLEDYRKNSHLPGPGIVYLPTLDFATDASGNVKIDQLKIEGDPLKTADTIVGAVTTVATVLSFTPLAPIAAPVAAAGGILLGIHAGMDFADMVEHGQSVFSEEGAMDAGMVLTSALPVGGSFARTAGLFREGIPLEDAAKLSFGAAKRSNPFTSTAQSISNKGGALFTASTVLHRASMYIGVPLLVDSAYNLAAHGDQMSDFDKLNNGLALATGVYGTSTGIHNEVRNFRGSYSPATWRRPVARTRQGSPFRSNGSPVTWQLPVRVNLGADGTLRTAQPDRQSVYWAIRAPHEPAAGWHSFHASPTSIPDFGVGLLDTAAPIFTDSTSDNSDGWQPTVNRQPVPQHRPGSQYDNGYPATGGREFVDDVNAKVRAALKVDANTPSTANLVVIAHDAAFDAAYRFRMGEDPAPYDGFIDSLPSGRPGLIYIRESAVGSFGDLLVGHEILHTYLHDTARRLTSFLMFDVNHPEDNLQEGFVELATFRIFGPDPYKSLPDGFRSYAEHAASRYGGVNPDDYSSLQDYFAALDQTLTNGGFEFAYVQEALAVEHIMAKMSVGGRDGAGETYRAFVGGDLAALRRFVATAESEFSLADLGLSGGISPHMPDVFGLRPNAGGLGPGPGDRGDSAAQSLSALLQRIATSNSPVTRNSIYNQYRLTGSPQRLAPRWDDETGIDNAPTDYLRGIRDLARGRPAQSEMYSQLGLQSSPGEFPGEPLLSAILDNNPNAEYTPATAIRDAFHFARAGGDPGSVTQRIYLHADVNHATDVMNFVVRNIVDVPDAFEGVVEAKIFGPLSAGRRTENIVIYVDTPENQQRVLRALAGYQQTHPDHFLPDVPAMTEPVAPGISIAEEPTPSMMLAADDALTAEGIPTEDELYSFGGLRSDAIYLAYRDTMSLQQSASGAFDFNQVFPVKVRERFIQFGIDPDNPARNIEPSGQAIQPEAMLPVSDAGGPQPPRDDAGTPPLGGWPRQLALTAGPQRLALPAGSRTTESAGPTLTPVRPPAGFAVNTEGVTTRAQYMWAVDGLGNAERILVNVSAGADHLAGVRPRQSSLGDWAERLISFYDNRVAKAAEKTPPLMKLYRLFYGDAAPPPAPSNFALRTVQIIRFNRVLFSITHDVHAHPEGYDARKGVYYARLMQMAGRYSEVFSCGIPQGCGVGHYTNPNSPPLSYKGAAALDARHLGEHQSLRENYVAWSRYMQRVARHDPLLARQVDQAAFKGDFEEVDRLLDSAPPMAIFARDDMKKLARQDPHLALNAHFASTGFNPELPASAWYVLRMNTDHYYEVTGEGETTLQKEGVSLQLRFSDENFDLENPGDVAGAIRWLAVQQVFGKITLIHSDAGTAAQGVDGRLVPTTNHGYDKFDPLMDLLAPFAQSPDSSTVWAHAGGGRFVNYDPTMKDVPGWLADAGYGDQIPHQILKMEEARRLAPGLKFDISWNDNGLQFATNKDLRRGLMQFMLRHPDAVLFGTDTVKPVNRSQYLQNLTTLNDFFVELAAMDRGVALNVIRRNFETMADRSFEKTLDAPTLRNMADKLDQFADKLENPTDVAMQRLADRVGPQHASAAAADIRQLANQLRQDAQNLGTRIVRGRDTAQLIQNGLSVNGPDGQPVTITIGRKQMRQVAQQLFQGVEFEWIADKFIAADPNRPLADQRAEAPSGDLVPVLPAKTGKSKTPNLADPQSGTGAGAPWVEQAGARWMVVSDATVTAAGGAAGLLPFVGPAAGLIRGGLYFRGLYRQEFSRRLWESIFEDGRGNGVSLFAHEIVRSGRAMQIPEERLAKFVRAMAQMDVDADYIYNETAQWARTNDPEHAGIEKVDWSKGDLPLAHHAMMAVIGIGQISGDAALGVQASSLLHLDPRTSKGRRHNLYISTSAAATATGSVATTAATVAALPPGAPQIIAGVIGGTVSLVVTGTQGIMILQKVWANRFGRGNFNPELNDRFRHLQTRLLTGIEAAGFGGAGNNVVLGVLSNGNFGLVGVTMSGVNVVLDLGVAWTAGRARRIEQARVELEGGTDPKPSARAVERLLEALGMDATASGISNANPTALHAWIDALHRALDELGW